MKLADEAVNYKGQQGQWWVTSQRFGRIARFWSHVVDYKSASLSWGYDFSGTDWRQSAADGKVRALEASMDENGCAYFAIDKQSEDGRVDRKVGLFHGKFCIDAANKRVLATEIRRVTDADFT